MIGGIQMKDLVKEGRELQDRVLENLKEQSFSGDAESVKESSTYEVVIPNSFDAFKKITGMSRIDLSKVKPKVAFQIFCALAKKGSTESDVDKFKTFVVVSTEDGDTFAFDGKGKTINTANVFRSTQLSSSTFKFGANRGKVILSKPEERGIGNTIDTLYKQSAKDFADFKKRTKEKIGLGKKKLGLGGETVVKDTNELTVIMPNSLESLKSITDKDDFNYKITKSDGQVAYQIFVVVHKDSSKNFNSKEYKTITVYANGDGTHQIFDHRDKKITIDELMKVTGLPRSLFRYGANEGEIFQLEPEFKPKNTLDLLKHIFTNSQKDGDNKAPFFKKQQTQKKDGMLKQIAKGVINKIKSKREIKEEDGEETPQTKQIPTTNADSRVVLDNKDVKISIPRSVEFIRDVSKDTKWMVTGGTFGGSEFDKYKKEKYTIYIIEVKKESPTYSNRLMRKVAVLVNASNQITCYDVMDNLVDLQKVLKIANTNRSFFKKMM